MTYLPTYIHTYIYIHTATKTFQTNFAGSARHIFLVTHILHVYSLMTSEYILCVYSSSYACTWEVWKALKKLELLSAAP